MLLPVVKDIDDQLVDLGDPIVCHTRPAIAYAWRWTEELEEQQCAIAVYGELYLPYEGDYIVVDAMGNTYVYRAADFTALFQEG